MLGSQNVMETLCTKDNVHFVSHEMNCGLVLILKIPVMKPGYILSTKVCVEVFLLAVNFTT